jgi:hypothetical protein
LANQGSAGRCAAQRRSADHARSRGSKRDVRHRSKGEFVMQTLRTLASSRQCVVKSSTRHCAKCCRSAGRSRFFHIEPECLQGGEHASTSFGDRRVIEKERLPYRICLLAFSSSSKTFRKADRIAGSSPRSGNDRRAAHRCPRAASRRKAGS